MHGYRLKSVGRSLTVFLLSSSIGACATGSVRERPPTPAEVRLAALTTGVGASADEEVARQAAEDEVTGQRKFAGLSFGAGISLTIDTGEHSRVDSAQIVNGIVRVDDENDTIARVLLDSHYFFQPSRRIFQVEPGNWGVGPFLALQPGSDDIVEAFGLGIMIGFKRPGNDGTSWNLGLGFIVDPDTQILGDGFVENQPPPAGESQVRFKEVSQEGVLLVVSFGF